MAEALISVEKIKAFWHSQLNDPDKWDLNMVRFTTHFTMEIALKLLRAVGLFAGSIIVMRQYGDLMAI